MKRFSSQAIPADSLRPPRLGDYLRALREHADLSRADLWERARVSISHIREIECADQRPTDQTLHALATGLRADSLQRRHLFALRDAATDLPARDDIGHEPSSTHQRWLHADTDLLLAFFDKRWNFVAANPAYTRMFPGMPECGHLVTWLFTPTARHVLVDWETEARTTVNWFRAILGRYHNSPWAPTVLEHLQADEDFRRLWNQTQLCTFGRENPYLHLRDPDGQLATIDLLIASTSPYTITHIGRPVPYCGPTSTKSREPT